MFQHKAILNVLLFLFSLILFLSLTGCATLAVDQFILHPRSEFVDEFTPTTIELAGIYSGRETINGHSYAIITVLNDSNDCKERPIIELLLPMEKNSDAKSTLRFGKSPKDLLSAGDIYAGQPVRIVFYSSSNDNEINIDKSMTSMLSRHNWIGYASVVIVGYKKGSRNIDRLAYRITSEANDILVRPFDCNGLCHSTWTCKNKEDNASGIILMPFALVFDFITAPVQVCLSVVNLFIPAGP